MVDLRFLKFLACHQVRSGGASAVAKPKGAGLRPSSRWLEQGSVPHSPKVAGLQNIFGRQKCSGSGSGCPEALANESSRIKQQGFPAFVVRRKVSAITCLGCNKQGEEPTATATKARMGEHAATAHIRSSTFNSVLLSGNLLHSY